MPMKIDLLKLINFEEVDKLLEGFNQTTGYVTAILDLEGNVLSKSGWRTFCTEFHRINPESSKNCSISDIVLANQVGKVEKYHFYECLNGLVDVAVPILIKGEHVANLFSGQFFFEAPNRVFFEKQADKFGFDKQEYMKALDLVPILSKEKVKVAMDFLLNMTQLISEITFQKTEQLQLNDALFESEFRFNKLYENGPFGMVLADNEFRFKKANPAFCTIMGYSETELQKLTFKEITHPDDLIRDLPEIQKLIQKEISVYKTEKRYIRKDGEVIWGSLTVTATYDSEGAFLYNLGIVEDITEKKGKDEKIREKDLEFRKLSANVPDLIFQFTRKTDGSYIVPIASEGIRNIFGCTPEEVLNDFTPISRVIFPEDAERVIQEIEYSAEHLTYFTCEFRVQIPGRGIQWILSNSTPERLPDGSVTWYGFNVDITNHKLIENALRESELLFSTTFKSSPIPISLTDATTEKCLEVNDAFLHVTGYTRTEIIGHTFRDINLWKRAENREKMRNLLIQDGHLNNHEVEILKKDGSTGIMLISVEIVELTGKSYVLIMGNEITEWKRVDADLRYHAELLNEVGYIAKVGGWEYDPLTDQSDWTEQVALIHDLPPDTPASVMLSINYYSEKSKPIIDTAFRAIVEKGIPYDLELEIITAKGNHKWVRTIGHPKFENDKVVRVYGSFQDITDRKKAEKEIQKLNETLEHRVAVRTSQLEAANNELEAFSYSVSHDLRAPLRHINGYVDLLNDRFKDNLPEKAKHYLSTISGSAKQMGTLIDDLLQFSRTGRQELHKTDIDMNVLLTESLQKIAPDLKSRAIKWNIQDLPMVLGDYSLLKQVWVNLLDNAVKYTKFEEKAEISIEYREERESFVFFVRDNGVGFDMKYASKLFGVFQRLHSQTEFEGTGIGLANVQRILQKHNGKVWADAELEKGATFYFSIPKK